MALEEYVEVDGGKLWARSSGGGPGMLMCHGGPGMWCYLEPLEEMLGDLVTLHRYDQRGCGRSDTEGPFTVEGYVEDIEALRRHFGYESWVAGGHSWGATLALAYAWTYPQRVRALVYMSGVGLGSAWRQAYRAEGRRRLTAAQRERYMALRSLEERDAEQEMEYLCLSTSRDFADREGAVQKARQFHEAGFDVNRAANRTLGAEMEAWVEAESVAKCGALKLPVLVVHGEMDPRPSWGGDTLVEALPDVRRVVLGGAGHMPWVERPAELRETLRSFLREQVLA